MGGIFSSPPPVVVAAPQQSTTSGTTEVSPFAPVVPFIEQILPEIRQTFTEAPELFTGSLVPQESAQTLAARDIFGQVGQTAAGLVPAFQNLFAADLARATADPTSDPIFQAQLGTIAQRARDITEADKATAQQQAIEAGQFGLGSTALGELQTLQQQRREELAQRQLSTALQEAEARRIAAQGRTPELAQVTLQSQLTPGSLQEAIGQQVEAREQAQLADAARLAQQEQEARRAQLITQANLFGGLAGLGSSTQLQQTSQGFTSSVLPGGPSPFSQAVGLVGAAAPFFSDKRMKTKIKFVRQSDNGIRWYTWEWTDKDIKQPSYGVIAQEVQKIKPEAVITGPDGFLMVNYGAL